MVVPHRQEPAFGRRIGDHGSEFVEEKWAKSSSDPHLLKQGRTRRIELDEDGGRGEQRPTHEQSHARCQKIEGALDHRRYVSINALTTVTTRWISSSVILG